MYTNPGLCLCCAEYTDHRNDRELCPTCAALAAECQAPQAFVARKAHDPAWNKWGGWVAHMKGIIGPDDLHDKLVDLQIALFCTAEEMGLDIIRAATEKAARDVERGVR